MQASSVARGMMARLGIRSYPISLTFELTWLCNLACLYCDRHTPMRHEMSREEIFSALDQAYALGMRRTNLDGGEALAHRHVDEIVDRLVERGVEVKLNSNGILVPKKIETVRRLSRLKISVDGPRESHDAMRGKDSFERALAGAEAARAAGVPVEFTCVVGRHNAGCIEGLLDIAEDPGGRRRLPTGAQQPVPGDGARRLHLAARGRGRAGCLRAHRAAQGRGPRGGQRLGQPPAFPALPGGDPAALRGGLGHGHDGPRRRALPLRAGQPQRSLQQRAPAGHA